jgi:anti-anti-sigma regulatory factor
MSGDGAVDRIVIHVDGVFDAAAAQRLTSAIAEADGEVRVDLTGIREFHDFGIAMLARALSGRSGVAVCGISQHQLRLLRYFGIDAGPVELAAPVELQ